LNPEYRNELLALLANSEHLICESEAVMVDPLDDLELLTARIAAPSYSKRWRSLSGI
jgi:hypothetical protein